MQANPRNTKSKEINPYNFKQAQGNSMSKEEWMKLYKIYKAIGVIFSILVGLCYFTEKRYTRYWTLRNYVEDWTVIAFISGISGHMTTIVFYELGYFCWFVLKQLYYITTFPMRAREERKTLMQASRSKNERARFPESEVESKNSKELKINQEKKRKLYLIHKVFVMIIVIVLKFLDEGTGYSPDEKPQSRGLESAGDLIIIGFFGHVVSIFIYELAYFGFTCFTSVMNVVAVPFRWNTELQNQRQIAEDLQKEVKTLNAKIDQQNEHFLQEMSKLQRIVSSKM